MQQAATDDRARPAGAGPSLEATQALVRAIKGLPDEELVALVRSVAAEERQATARLVAHLAELGARELHLSEGYSSLFVYCRDALAFSEHDSYNRIEVARAARRFPVVLGLIDSGALNLTTVRLLAPHLTAENHLSVLGSARGKRKAQVEEIVASLAPFPEAPTFVRKLPPPRVFAGPPAAVSMAAPVAAPLPAPPAVATCSAPPLPAAGGALPGNSSVTCAGPPGAPAPGPPPAPAGATPTSFQRAPSHDVTPLSPDRYKLQLTIGGATLEKLRLAQDMLRHAIPSGDEAAVLDRALTVLLADLARARFAATSRPGPGQAPTPGSRHIPADVKRAVWLRDLGRCAFVGTGGHRCNDRAFVEFHHVRPYAAGGEATPDNIQLRCRRHNGYESRTFFSASRAAEASDEVREPVVAYGD